MRSRFAEMDCSVAQALEVLGDWWTLLIVREAFFGVRRFGAFQENLGISRNVLSQRLAHLVEHGVLERVDVGEHGTHFEYTLTPMGKDLALVLTALRQWADRWVVGAGNESLVVCDRRTGRTIPRQRIRGEDGSVLGARDMELRPGPGANATTRARFR
jgi:DNA-binding HxlR family transcriptional regulator